MYLTTIVRRAASTIVTEVVGLPDWAERELYDITVKVPAGSKRSDVAQMWQTMLANRFKLKAHVEERKTARHTGRPSRVMFPRHESYPRWTRHNGARKPVSAPHDVYWHQNSRV